jgi:hypothetical protein
MTDVPSKIVRKPLPLIAGELRDRETGGQRANINWHDEELLEVLTAAHKEGLSATQIMFRIHDHYIVPAHASLTRNAVLGALHRKGIKGSDRSFRPRRTNPSDVPAASKQRGRPKGVGNGGGRAQRIVAQAQANARAAVMAEGKAGADEVLAQYGDLEPWERMSIPFIAPEGKRTIALVKLNETTCRWPFECDDGMEGKHTFCGDAVRPGTGFPYCPMHARLASGGMPPPKKSAPYPMRTRQTR